MTNTTLAIKLAPIDMRILRECAHFQAIYWKEALKACHAGEASPMDYHDTYEEADLE